MDWKLSVQFFSRIDEYEESAVLADFDLAADISTVEKAIELTDRMVCFLNYFRSYTLNDSSL